MKRHALIERFLIFLLTFAIHGVELSIWLMIRATALLGYLIDKLFNILIWIKKGGKNGASIQG